MKKLFLIISAALLLLLTGCNPMTSGNGFDKLVKIKNFEKYTGLGVGNKNTARSARSLTTDYLTSCGLFGQNPDGTYELLIFEDEQGHEVDQSYYLKNFCDNETFIFISFTEEDKGFSTEFGMGDYTYCVNKADGKMYNIGDKFVRLNLLGTSQYNAYVRLLTETEYKLFRLSFENELLKIEEVFDFYSVPFEVKVEVVDKFGTYANNVFYINKDDTEITRFSENVNVSLGYNDRIYIGNNWFDNGELVPAEFVPSYLEFNSYKKTWNDNNRLIHSYGNVNVYYKPYDIYTIVTFDGESYTTEDIAHLQYAVNNYLFYIDYINQKENLVKYDFYNKEEVERYDYISTRFNENAFEATDSDWNKISGYVDSVGVVHTDMIEYENKSIKITFISALN